MPMARSVLLWFVLVIALAGGACTQPSDGGGSSPAAPAGSDGAPAASESCPPATSGPDGY